MIYHRENRWNRNSPICLVFTKIYSISIKLSDNDIIFSIIQLLVIHAKNIFYPQMFTTLIIKTRTLFNNRRIFNWIIPNPYDGLSGYI